MLALAALQRRLQTQPEETPQIHSAEELDAYVKERVAELDALIKECEERIEKLDVKKKDERELRIWLQGTLRGLYLARAAWSWWGKNTE